MESSEKIILKELRRPNVKTSFVNGMFSGIGFVVGSTIIIALLVFILRPFIDVPVIGNFINEIIEVVENPPNEN